MNKIIYCTNCNLEFRIKYDAEDGLFEAKWCPFCQEELDPDEQYTVDEDQDEA